MNEGLKGKVISSRLDISSEIEMNTRHDEDYARSHEVVRRRNSLIVSPLKFKKTMTMTTSTHKPSYRPPLLVRHVPKLHVHICVDYEKDQGSETYCMMTGACLRCGEIGHLHVTTYIIEKMNTFFFIFLCLSRKLDHNKFC